MAIKVGINGFGRIGRVRIGNWYKRQLNAATAAPVTATAAAAELPRRKIHRALLILTVLVFSKYFYIACMTNYFTFFLMDKFAFSVQDAQYSLFAFLAASAAGTVIGLYYLIFLLFLM